MAVKKRIDERTLMITALKQVSFFSRINHTKWKDYGEVVDAVLISLGETTGEL